MTKPKFIMRLRDGTEKSVSYTPLIYSRMNEVYKFALHKVAGLWIVSHIESGAKVCNVNALYKGMPVSSRGLTLRQARIDALDTIDALVDRIGFDKFDSVINNPKPF